MTIQAKALGEVLGVSQTTLQNYRERGMPQERYGEYDGNACLKWWLINVYDSSGESKGINEIKKQYWKVQTGLKMLEYNKQKGLLVPLDEVETAWSARVSIVTSGLEMLTNRLPPLLVGRDRDEIQDTLAAEFRALREQYAARGEHCGETPPMPEPEPAKPPKAVKKKAAKAKAKAKTPKQKGIKK